MDWAHNNLEKSQNRAGAHHEVNTMSWVIVGKYKIELSSFYGFCSKFTCDSFLMTPIQVLRLW